MRTYIERMAKQTLDQKLAILSDAAKYGAQRDFVGAGGAGGGKGADGKERRAERSCCFHDRLPVVIKSPRSLPRCSRMHMHNMYLHVIRSDKISLRQFKLSPPARAFAQAVPCADCRGIKIV